MKCYLWTKNFSGDLTKDAISWSDKLKIMTLNDPEQIDSDFHFVGSSIRFISTLSMIICWVLALIVIILKSFTKGVEIIITAQLIVI